MPVSVLAAWLPACRAVSVVDERAAAGCGGSPATPLKKGDLR
jgi:hypothetical protein